MWFHEHLQSVPTGYDSALFPCKFYWNPNSSLQISVNIRIFSQSQFTKRINSFPFCFHLTNSFEMTFPVLNGFFFWETHAGVCTVTVMVIRLLFHLESNIMMTLKLDMKHICKKDMRRGWGGGEGLFSYLGLGGVSGRRWGGESSAQIQRGGGGELRAFLRKGSRCRDRTAPQWLAWFCCRSPLASLPVQ